MKYKKSKYLYNYAFNNEYPRHEKITLINLRSKIIKNYFVFKAILIEKSLNQ